MDVDTAGHGHDGGNVANKNLPAVSPQAPEDQGQQPRSAFGDLLRGPEGPPSPGLMLAFVVPLFRQLVWLWVWWLSLELLVFSCPICFLVSRLTFLLSMPAFPFVHPSGPIASCCQPLLGLVMLCLLFSLSWWGASFTGLASQFCFSLCFSLSWKDHFAFPSWLSTSVPPQPTESLAAEGPVGPGPMAQGAEALNAGVEATLVEATPGPEAQGVGPSTWTQSRRSWRLCPSTLPLGRRRE